MQWLTHLVWVLPAIAHPSSVEILRELAFELAEVAALQSPVEPGPILEKRSISCVSCQYMLAGLKKLPRHKSQEASESYVQRKQSQGELVPFNFAKDLLNALSLMDPLGDDGRYMCHYIMGKSCPLPLSPQIDYQKLLPAPPVDGVVVPQSRGRTFKVVHLSDIHLQLNYTIGSPVNCIGAMCCGAKSIPDPLVPLEPAPRFGAYKCDAPLDLLFSALHDVSTIDKKFDFALFTGDMVDHDPVLMSKSLCFAEEETAMRALKTYLKDIPVYSVFGNHDSYPFSQDAAKWTGFASRFSYNAGLMAHLWEDSGWIGKQQARDIEHHHGAYAINARPGLRVIAMNTNFWYVWNFYNYARTGEPDPSGMLQFVVDQLVDCERTGTRAWIIGHVPPGGLPDEALPFHSEYFAAILERFSKTIAATFFGHTHRDEFTVLYGNNATDVTEKNALLTAFMAPSVTPFTDLNPGWRYYDVDEDTFEVVDIKTYYANINDYADCMDHTKSLQWQLGYSARDTYGPMVGGWPSDAPLNATFWHRVAESILINPNMAQLYTEMAMRKSPFVPECDLMCRQKQYCYTTSMTSPQAMRCRASFKNKSGRPWAILSQSGVGASRIKQPFGEFGRPLQQILEA